MFWRRPILISTVVLVVGAGAALFVQDEVTRPTLADVLGGTISGAPVLQGTSLPREENGVLVPNLDADGFTAGETSRAPLRDHRDAITVAFRRGSQRLTYTVISGTGWVDDERLGGIWTSNDQKIQAPSRHVTVREGTLNGRLLMNFQRNGHYVLLTGSPISPSLRSALRHIALR